MTVYARMLEVDAGCPVGSHYDLQLFVPPIRTCPNLNSPLELVSSRQHVLARLIQAFWHRVVEAHDEERSIDNIDCILAELLIS